MKKVIVAAAGLMLVGTMATSAMAEFQFSGDARVRYYYQDNYNSDGGFFNSRVRVKVEATTKGGAYMKSRIKYSDGTFGDAVFNFNDGEYTSTSVKDSQFQADYAYIGVPFGPVTVEGGRMPRDITPFSFFDGRAEGVQVKYKNDTTGLVVFYDTVVEGTTLTGETDYFTPAGVEYGTDSVAYPDDDDISQIGFLLNQDFSGGWGMNLGGIYVMDDVDDGIDVDGAALATVKVTGAFGDIAVEAELGYQTEEWTGYDDGFGFYVGATIPAGPASVYVMAGATFDGFLYDAADFGPFAIFNDYSQISEGTNLSGVGENLFLVVNPTFKASEKLTLGAIASVIDIDAYDAADEDATLWEVGATASYAVTDGAKLNGIIAYGDTDDTTEDDLFGVGLSLEISF